jgi:hypothetical protein
VVIVIQNRWSFHEIVFQDNRNYVNDKYGLTSIISCFWFIQKPQFVLEQLTMYSTMVLETIICCSGTTVYFFLT